MHKTHLSQISGYHASQSEKADSFVSHVGKIFRQKRLFLGKLNEP